MRTRAAVGTLMLVVGVLAPPSTRAADRLPDKDVKQLLERVDHDRDRFEDALDGKVKHNVMRTAEREVDVGQFLDDLQENTGRLKDRFTDKYAASAEVTTVLRQAADIDRAMSKQPANFKGSSEWARLRSSLTALAEVYGTRFPLPEGASARRLNDAEVKHAADEIAEAAKQYKKALQKTFQTNPSIDKPTGDAALAEADLLEREAKALGSRVDDGKPAAGEARQVFDRVAGIKASLSRIKVLPEAQSAWSAVTPAMDKVAQAFGMPAR